MLGGGEPHQDLLELIGGEIGDREPAGMGAVAVVAHREAGLLLRSLLLLGQQVGLVSLGGLRVDDRQHAASENLQLQSVAVGSRTEQVLLALLAHGPILGEGFDGLDDDRPLVCQHLAARQRGPGRFVGDQGSGELRGRTGITPRGPGRAGQPRGCGGRPRLGRRGARGLTVGQETSLELGDLGRQRRHLDQQLTGLGAAKGPGGLLDQRVEAYPRSAHRFTDRMSRSVGVVVVCHDSTQALATDSQGGESGSTMGVVDNLLGTVPGGGWWACPGVSSTLAGARCSTSGWWLLALAAQPPWVVAAHLPRPRDRDHMRASTNLWQACPRRAIKLACSGVGAIPSRR